MYHCNILSKKFSFLSHFKHRSFSFLVTFCFLGIFYWIFIIYQYVFFPDHFYLQVVAVWMEKGCWSLCTKFVLSYLPELTVQKKKVFQFFLLGVLEIQLCHPHRIFLPPFPIWKLQLLFSNCIACSLESEGKVNKDDKLTMWTSLPCCWIWWVRLLFYHWRSTCQCLLYWEFLPRISGDKTNWLRAAAGEEDRGTSTGRAKGREEGRGRGGGRQGEMCAGGENYGWMQTLTIWNQE